MKADLDVFAGEFLPQTLETGWGAFRRVMTSADPETTEVDFEKWEKAVALLHRHGISDRYPGSARSKIFFLIDDNDELRCGVLIDDLAPFIEEPRRLEGGIWVRGDHPEYHTECPPECGHDDRR